ncbi:hypothetical protein [Winogradskyella alexanderae]|uniref:DUF4412 domain-containing protein n=1 Tax=Winogradskyella alexanderae TaxID=2877123 RepID=A0ABS7XWN3_9FLAO|nr:hypothetical protein [Winogradskyella alexanderae]MCA0133823.1 hypothetical protein [Winogradskyella alexanderae]
MRRLIICICVVATSVVLTAQEKITEGIITSKQTMTSSNPAMKQQFEMIGDIISTTYFKGAKSRGEISNPMSGNVVGIVDAESMSSLTLMDGPMGKKYMMTKVDNVEELMKTMSVEKTDETKTILGYECTAYDITLEQQGMQIKMKMFATDKIQPVFSGENMALYEQVEGFPMMMTSTINQMGTDIIITTEVTEIKQVEVSDDKFDMTIPEGYTEMKGM